ncbi:MAG: helicase-related protein [Sandaracinaceae bacterium]
MRLPIDALRGAVEAALAEGPVVLAAPTGSGKSTQVPRWLPGKVVVIEPRRVACRSLASRIASLEGCRLGAEIGYRVRHDVRASEQTRVLFVTPGIALRDRSLIERADALVIDELHERRLDVDLLLALHRTHPRLVAMSATMDGDKVAAYLGGQFIEGTGRLHPVEVRYLETGAVLPHADKLAIRVLRAVEEAAALPGDVLVFLPGRAEIQACEDALSERSLDVVPLHGGLSLDQQGRAFERAARRKVVLATNVAETSVTIPGIGVVIDSGLVRRTRYHKGRGYLTRSPVAMDSADQRAGRAGRTGPGVCLRLWSEAAILDKRTAPEVHRESLVPMMLAAAHAGIRLESLPLLDAAKDYALDAAREELTALGAISDDGLTPIGAQLFAQPLDPPHARLLVEAEKHPALLGDAIDLVSVLAVGRPLFVGAARDPEDDLTESGCDVRAALEAMRRGDPRQHGLSAFVLSEARKMARRLRRAHGLESHSEASIDRRALGLLFMAADPRCAHVARRRGGKKRKMRVAFANGGAEVELGSRSAAAKNLESVEAVLVLETRALGIGLRDTRVVATMVMPAPLSWLRDAGLGRSRVESVTFKRGRVLARVEQVHAKKVLDVREEVPTGALARDAIQRLLLDNRLLKGTGRRVADRLTARALARRLAQAGFELDGMPLPSIDPVPTLEEHLAARLLSLGVETGEDAALLSAEDLLPEPLDPWIQERLDEHYPRTYDLGDASYEIDYDVKKRQVLMRMVRGSRDTPPPPGYLPRFPGFRVRVETRRSIHLVRG